MHGGREQWPLLALLFTASLGGLLACLLFQKKSSRSPDQRAYFFRTKAWTANVKLGLTQRPVYFWFPAAAISPAVVSQEEKFSWAPDAFMWIITMLSIQGKKLSYQSLCSDGWRKDGALLFSQFPDFFILLFQTVIATQTVLPGVNTAGFIFFLCKN